MVHDYGRGASLSQLAAKHGISVSCVHRILDREGVDFRPQWWGQIYRDAKTGRWLPPNIQVL
jgi:hypothetical protein